MGKYDEFTTIYTKNQLKTVQKIEHNLAYMDYAMIFCLQFYWLLVLYWTTQQFTLFCINNPKNQQNYYYPQSVILHRLRLLFSDTCYSYLENTVEIT